MLCAGFTVYSPLVRHGAGARKQVAVVVVGGLGHYAIFLGNALGAAVTAFSHQQDRLADVKIAAAHAARAVGDGFAEPCALELELIILTAGVTQDTALNASTKTMNVPRKFVTCGLLDHPFPGLEGVAPLEERRLLRRLDGADMLAMFQLAADKGLRRWWVSLIPMEDVTIALQNVKDKQVRYPYLLTADIYGPPGLDAAEAAAEEKKLFQSAQEAVG